MTKQEKLKEVEKFRKQLQKTYGEDVLKTGAESMETLRKRIIPTTSLELNRALYCGGFCGIVELFGAPASGKTSLAIETLALNQSLDPDFFGLWVETEGSITPELLEQHNVDLDRLMFVSQEDVDNAENLMDITVGAARKGLPDLIIVNSIAGLAPQKEVEDDLDKQQIGVVAKLMSKYLRVINGPISKNKITAIYINQIRDKIGVMFGDPTTTPGGKALGFYANQRIRMNSVKVQSTDPITPEEGIKVSNIVQKNRLAGIHNPYTKCEYFARFGDGIDSSIPIPDMLVEAGVFEKAGSWYTYKMNDKVVTIEGVECKFNSRKAFSTVLRENPNFCNAMMNLLNMQEANPEVVTEEELEKIKKEEELIKQEIGAFDNELASEPEDGTSSDDDEEFEEE